MAQTANTYQFSPSELMYVNKNDLLRLANQADAALKENFATIESLQRTITEYARKATIAANTKDTGSATTVTGSRFDTYRKKSETSDSEERGKRDSYAYLAEFDAVVRSYQLTIAPPNNNAVSYIAVDAVRPIVEKMSSRILLMLGQIGTTTTEIERLEREAFAQCASCGTLKNEDPAKLNPKVTTEVEQVCAVSVESGSAGVRYTFVPAPDYRWRISQSAESKGREVTVTVEPNW